MSRLRGERSLYLRELAIKCLSDLAARRDLKTWLFTWSPFVTHPLWGGQKSSMVTTEDMFMHSDIIVASLNHYAVCEHWNQDDDRSNPDPGLWTTKCSDCGETWRPQATRTVISGG